jgi:two-component system CheB/CheR fusion protein
LQTEARTETDVEKESDKLLLTRYVPASVLVNKDLEILRFRGVTSPFLQPAPGKASLNLLKMVNEDLIFEMRSLMQKAKKTETLVSKNDIHVDTRPHPVSIEVVPIRNAKDVYYLIIFNEHRIESENAEPTKKEASGKGGEKARMLKAEQSLKDAHEHVRAITEDFDVSREELQSANEEILSSNEELQSINEELETSKEELQSANEELTTINEELQTRIEELKQSRDYAEAIIGTMRGPLLVLSSQMRIRTANKAFYEFFKLNAEDTEGRYIYDLNSGQWDIPTLRDHFREVFSNKSAFKDFEITHNFPIIGKRTMVLNAHKLVHDANGKETQILLAFEDITPYREAEKNLRETQEQLKLALQGGSVGTWQWNIKTNALIGSGEQAELFGLREKSFFKTFAEWENTLHPDDLSEVRKQLHLSIAEKKPLDIEFRITWPDRSTHWILSKANTYYDKDGNADRMMGVNIDITERKRAVEALAESEKRFHMMSDNAPVMIWMSDADQQCNFVNKTWLSFTGKTFQEQTGKGWLQGIHPEDRDIFFESYDSAYMERAEFKIDYRLKRHDGHYRWIMNHGVPRYTNDGTFLGYIGTCIDITERIDLEKQKDDFMGIASHELKTPVTSIKAYAQILHEKFTRANDVGSATMLGRLDNQIDKLTSLINALLDVARIQSGQMEYDETLFEIGPFVQEITEEMQRTSSKHEIQVVLNAGGNVFADRARIGQVLSNLISNAIKYSGDANKIIVETKQDDNGFIFTVQDFGIGIPSEMQDQIFGRFFRVSEASGNRASGLGLGLYICSQIVVQHNGHIWVESDPGKGSLFGFSLPSKHDA